MAETDVREIVSRFLSWRLPQDFAPDNGISYRRPNYAPEVDATPVGTNLLNAEQAEAMVQHILGDVLTRPPQPEVSGEDLEPGELLPCPFCGGKAEVVEIEEGENEGGSCVSCTKCQASSNVDFGYKENFVANWNSRAAARSPSAPTGEGLHRQIEIARSLAAPSDPPQEVETGR